MGSMTAQIKPVELAIERTLVQPRALIQKKMPLTDMFKWVRIIVFFVLKCVRFTFYRPQLFVRYRRSTPRTHRLLVTSYADILARQPFIVARRHHSLNYRATQRSIRGPYSDKPCARIAVHHHHSNAKILSNCAQACTIVYKYINIHV